MPWLSGPLDMVEEVVEELDEQVPECPPAAADADRPDGEDGEGSACESQDDVAVAEPDLRPHGVFISEGAAQVPLLAAACVKGVAGYVRCPEGRFADVAPFGRVDVSKVGPRP